MQALNVTDAISPAFKRAHLTLVKQVSAGRTIALAGCQYLSTLGGMFVPFPLLVFLMPPHMLVKHDSVMRLEIYGGALALTALQLAVLYLGVRLELACFELLTTRTSRIRPAWRRYANRVWPWIGLKFLAGTVVAVTAGLMAFGPAWNWLKAVDTTLPGKAGDGEKGALIFAGVLAFYGGFLLLALVAITVGTILTDFVLPFYLLGGRTAFGAVAQAMRVARRDWGQFLLYLLLKPVLYFTGMMMESLALNLCMLVLMMVGALPVWLTTALATHVAGPAAATGVGIVWAAIAGVVYLAFLVASIAGAGYLSAVAQAYGIYFMAGRYDVLAHVVEGTAELAP